MQDLRGRDLENQRRGEINVLDPGGFGALTIIKSISILSRFAAGVLGSGMNGIIVNAPAATDKVLRDHQSL